LTETEGSDETKKRKDKEDKAKTREEDGATPSKRARTDNNIDSETPATKAEASATKEKKRLGSPRDPGSDEASATKAEASATKEKKRLGSPRDPGSDEASATKATSKKKRLGSPRDPGSDEVSATKAGSKKKPWSSPREPGSRRSSRYSGSAGQVLLELDGNRAKVAVERQVKHTLPGHTQCIRLPIDCMWPEDSDISVEPDFKQKVKTFEAEELGFPRSVTDADLSWIMIQIQDPLFTEILKKWSEEWTGDKSTTWSLAQCGTLDVTTMQVCGMWSLMLLKLFLRL
jgi:hypothetical protein